MILVDLFQLYYDTMNFYLRRVSCMPSGTFFFTILQSCASVGGAAILPPKYLLWKRSWNGLCYVENIHPLASSSSWCIRRELSTFSLQTSLAPQLARCKDRPAHSTWCQECCYWLCSPNHAVSACPRLVTAIKALSEGKNETRVRFMTIPSTEYAIWIDEPQRMVRCSLHTNISEEEKKKIIEWTTTNTFSK